MPPLKALGKRLVVVRPSGPPDPTLRNWRYSFNGEYFKLLERDPKTRDLLRCDRSRNASYAGVIPSWEVVLAGLREQATKRRSAATVAAPVVPAVSPLTISAVAVAAATAIGGTGSSGGDTSVRTTSSGSDVDAGEPGGPSGQVGRGALERYPDAMGESTQPPALAGTGEAAAGAKPDKGVLAGTALVRGSPPTVGAVAGSSRDLAVVEGKQQIPERKWSLRIREAEVELRALQEVKIPRFVLCYNHSWLGLCVRGCHFFFFNAFECCLCAA